MVLVDTSVWIRFLSNRSPYAGELDELLRRGEVSGHDFVLGEFLIGDRDRGCPVDQRRLRSREALSRSRFCLALS
jgi:predicted nucleic acid-binding protein